MMNFTTEDFEIKAFYSYPTCVVNRLNEYEEGIGKVRGIKTVKSLFDKLLKETEEKLKKYHLIDNKIAIEVIHKSTNTKLYFGYKDNVWCIGLSLNTYMTGQKITVEN